MLQNILRHVSIIFDPQSTPISRPLLLRGQKKIGKKVKVQRLKRKLSKKIEWTNFV